MSTRAEDDELVDTGKTYQDHSQSHNSDIQQRKDLQAYEDILTSVIRNGTEDVEERIPRLEFIKVPVVEFCIGVAEVFPIGIIHTWCAERDDDDEHCDSPEDELQREEEGQPHEVHSEKGKESEEEQSNSPPETIKRERERVSMQSQG